MHGVRCEHTCKNMPGTLWDCFVYKRSPGGWGWGDTDGANNWASLEAWRSTWPRSDDLFFFFFCCCSSQNESKILSMRKELAQSFSKIPFTTLPSSGGLVFIWSFLRMDYHQLKQFQSSQKLWFEVHIHIKVLPPIQRFALWSHTEQG